MPFYNSVMLKRIASTVLGALDVEPPEGFAKGLEWLVAKLQKKANGAIDRVVMYHADAVGMYMFQRYTELFEPVMTIADASVPFVSTVTSMTPVAHASMYTGLDPDGHGIRVYERPRLECDTVYDVLIRAGLHPAIIAMRDSTFVHIFAGRDMDVYEVDSNEEALKKAEELIKSDRHELISIHTFEYDDNAHDFGPESPEAMAALKREIAGFDALAGIIEARWPGHNTMLAYAPDHGQHNVELWEPNPENHKGDHGSMRMEDMNVMQFYSLIPRRI